MKGIMPTSDWHFYVLLLFFAQVCDLYMKTFTAKTGDKILRAIIKPNLDDFS